MLYCDRCSDRNDTLRLKLREYVRCDGCGRYTHCGPEFYLSPNTERSIEITEDKGEAIVYPDTLAGNIAETVDALRKAEADLADAREQLSHYPAVWRVDSSLETWFPLTAEELQQVRRERDLLRAALIATGRNMGCLLTDDVSSDFLLRIPLEASLVLRKIRGENR